MKNFTTFLYESEFSNDDFFKHDYLKQVLDDIVQTGEIGLGETSIEKMVKVDDEVRKQLATFIDSPEKLENGPAFTAITLKNSTPFRWTSIYKGKYSGQEHQSAGEYAEAAVAYIYNSLNGNTAVNEAEDESLEKVIQVLADKNVTADWIASSKLSAEKLHNDISQPKKYFAAHVDGKDISKVPENVLKVAMIFKGKPGIKAVIGDKIDASAINNLYSSSGGKDTWNKADIVLVNTDLNLVAELKDKHFAVSDEFNLFINDLINKNMIIPVSLKKISPKAKLSDIIIKKEGKVDEIEKTQDEIDLIKNVDIVLPLTVNPDQKYVGTCYLKTNTGLRVDFRHGKAERESLNIEIKLKTARGGKALSELKRKLNLTTDFYKSYYFETEEDYLSELKRLTGMSIVPKASLSKSDAKWFIRPAFKGLVALLSIFQTNVQQNNKPVDLVKFFQMIYNCASGANSDSIFYLLTMK